MNRHYYSVKDGYIIIRDLKKTKTDDDKFGTTPWFLFQMNEMTVLDYNTVHWWPSLFYTYKSAVYSSQAKVKLAM